MQRRKVIVRKLGGEIIKGYLETIPELKDRKPISIVSLTEEVITVSKQEIKALFFVRKFSGDKEYNEVKFFKDQPRIDGLWVRLTFFDNETVEGIVSNSGSFLLEDGFYVIPADPKSNNRLIYVPKAALKDFRILGTQYSKGDLLEYFQSSHHSRGAEPLSPTAFASGAADSLFSQEFLQAMRQTTSKRNT
jgi:hypothetical protein